MENKKIKKKRIRRSEDKILLAEIKEVEKRLLRFYNVSYTVDQKQEVKNLIKLNKNFKEKVKIFLG